MEFKPILRHLLPPLLAGLALALAADDGPRPAGGPALPPDDGRERIDIPTESVKLPREVRIWRLAGRIPETDLQTLAPEDRQILRRIAALNQSAIEESVEQAAIGRLCDEEPADAYSWARGIEDAARAAEAAFGEAVGELFDELGAGGRAFVEGHLVPGGFRVQFDWTALADYRPDVAMFMFRHGCDEYRVWENTVRGAKEVLAARKAG